MYTQSNYIYVLPVSETALTAANDLVAWVVDHNVEVVKVSFLVTTGLGTFTAQAPVLSLSYTASGGSKVEKSTVTLVASSAVGTETSGTDSSTNALPFNVFDGDTLTFAVKTAGSGGSTTGAGYWQLELRELPRG